MGGRKSQVKGRNAERELAKLLQGYGYNVDLCGLDGIHVECKRAEQLRLSEWLVQAERDAQRFEDGLPAVFFRRSREPWAVVMRLSDWIKLYQNQKTAENRT